MSGDAARAGLLQDEAEGYECQRLSKWFASRLDAREVVRRYHTRNQDETNRILQNLFRANDVPTV